MHQNEFRQPRTGRALKGSSGFEATTFRSQRQIAATNDSTTEAYNLDSNVGWKIAYNIKTRIMTVMKRSHTAANEAAKIRKCEKSQAFAILFHSQQGNVSNMLAVGPPIRRTLLEPADSTVFSTYTGSSSLTEIFGTVSRIKMR